MDTAKYYGLETRTVKLSSYWAGPDWGGKQVVTKEMFLSRPEGYVLPRRTLMEMRKMYNEQSGKTKRSVERWRQKVDKVLLLDPSHRLAPRIAPLEENGVTLLNTHGLDLDTLAYIFSKMDIGDIARIARVCKYWNRACASNTLWRCMLARMVSPEDSNHNTHTWWVSTASRASTDARALVKEFHTQWRVHRLTACISGCPLKLSSGFRLTHFHEKRAPPTAELLKYK